MYYICLHVQSHLCNPWTVACQASLSVEFSRQEYWSGLPFSTPGDIPNPEIGPESPVSPVLAGRFFTTVINDYFLKFEIEYITVFKTFVAQLDPRSIQSESLWVGD